MTATVYICNAFSLAMLDRENPRTLRPAPIEAQRVREWLGMIDQMEDTEYVSAVGHEDTARLISAELEREIPANRISVKLGKNDSIFVAQYAGPRLPEGVSTLPDGARFDWWLV